MAGYESWDERWVARALERGPIDVVDDVGITPLWHATYFGQVAWVKKLLAAGARVDAHVPSRIERAAGSGFVVALWHGKLRNEQVPRGESTLLHAAVTRTGTEDVVRALLTHGLSPTARDRYGDTPLHVAAFARRPDLFGVLVEAGAELEALDHADYTPLDHTALHVDRIQRLLELGASPDGGPRARDPLASPFNSAAYSGRVDVLRILLDAGAHLDRYPKALFYAAEQGQPECVRFLLQAGMSAGATFEDHGSARHALAAAARYAHLACCEALGARPQAELDEALADAIEYCNIDYPDPPNDRGPVRRKLVHWLIDQGANPTLALPNAILAKDGSYACLLVERGARIDATSPDSDPPLVLAARRGHRALAELLLARGADPKARASDGTLVYNVAQHAYNHDHIDDARFVMAAIASAGGRPAAPAQPASAASPGVGSRVRHATFGDGTIKAITGHKWTIAFDAGGEKVLLSKFLTLAS